MPKTARLPVGSWRFWAIPLAILIVAWWPRPSTAPAPARAEAGWRVVERAVDGDTVVLVGGERVRYIGVDTPELHHPKKPVQLYAREAWLFNRRVVEGRRVRLEYDVQARDRYQRTLAYVFLEDGTFVNAELIRQGYAHILTIPPNVKYQDRFLALEREARTANRGLWSRR
ncbi:MAG: hypothetical protein A3C53_06500 [Omnitrophica WOR_2 bacterium RIFCSPHIGHO2_02_FULL_68_15]|nr:MAG: hypothetical protein A3C53_06500 [Omnitrophica WOR_2 bacterium RIFCSPHIGHO2_02_FULL_68_15]